MTRNNGGFMKRFNPEDLAQCNGQNGNPVYIAHKGNVYDVTESKLWKGGLHMRRHNAGTDLTTDIQAAPHDIEVLERYPLIGTLSVEAHSAPQLPGWIALLLDTNPFFRRHPHPMTVHFPIVFMLSYPIFNLLFWATGNRDFESTAASFSWRWPWLQDFSPGGTTTWAG
jgi:predicted heme/steroid binding protein